MGWLFASIVQRSKNQRASLKLRKMPRLSDFSHNVLQMFRPRFFPKNCLGDEQRLDSCFVQKADRHFP